MPLESLTQPADQTQRIVELLIAALQLRGQSRALRDQRGIGCLIPRWILVLLNGDVLANQSQCLFEGSSGCGSAWKRDPGSGVIGVEKGPLIPLV
jgi:hypothetical protein